MKAYLISSAMLAVICMSLACNTKPVKPDAKPVPVKSPVPDAIAVAKSEAAAALAAVENKVAAAQAELAALEIRSSKAAAQVRAAQAANTNAPAGPVKQIVDGETGLALRNLPAPDAKEELEAAKRRAAIEEGRAAEAEARYNAARSESDQMKSEMMQLRASTAAAGQVAQAAIQKSESAQAALVAAEKANAAALEKNRAANQAALDDLAAKLQKSEDDRKNAETKEQVKWLRIIGLACLVAGIGIGVMTNGIQLAKSVGFGACALACFGLAQIVAHRWFLPVSIGCVVLAACGGAYWFWREREDALKKSTMEKQVAELEKIDLRTVPTTDDRGRPSNLAVEFDRVMDKPEKAVVKRLVTAVAVKAAKAS